MRPWLLADLIAKALAIGVPLLAIVVLQGAGAGSRTMAIRLSLYMVSVVVIPAIWVASGRPRPYPYLADIAIVAPFILDAGRIAIEVSAGTGLDAGPHLGGWACISLVVGLAIGPLVRERWIGFGLMVGTGAVVVIVWELAEYVVATRIRGIDFAYPDTIADLGLSLTGAVIGALLTVRFAWPPATTPRTLFGWSR